MSLFTFLLATLQVPLFLFFIVRLLMTYNREWKKEQGTFTITLLTSLFFLVCNSILVIQYFRN